MRFVALWFLTFACVVAKWFQVPPFEVVPWWVILGPLGLLVFVRVVVAMLIAFAFSYVAIAEFTE